MADPNDRRVSKPAVVSVPSRREMLRAVTLGGAAVAASGWIGAPRPARAFGETAGEGSLAPVRYSFRVAKEERGPPGRSQPAILASGSFPAPEIRFRAGFLLRVDLANGLDEATAIHWHGLPVPNPMDGEIGVTQLPIDPGAVATYEFPAARPGTYWYHSTAGFQRQLGLAGPLVVEERDDPYDTKRDHVVFLSDWLGGDPAGVIPGLRARGGEPEEATRGRFVNPAPDGGPFPTDVRFDGFSMNGRGHRNAWTCEADTGDRIRLRLINGSSQTFFRFKIAGHRMEVVAADGRPVTPVDVDDLVIGTGERYDVIVTLGASGSYPIRAVALGQSGGAVGVLHTRDAKPVVSTVAPKWGGLSLRYGMLRAREARALPPGAIRNLRVALGEDASEYRFTMGGQSFPSDPGADGIGKPLNVQPGERVRLELENQTRLFQAVHLHGHAFRLLEKDVDPDRVPRKDTLSMAPGARARIEFAADNPGRWLLDGVGLYRRRAGLARVLAYVAGTDTR